EETCARATSLERPLRSCHLPQAFRALAPVAQWIEQRFPKPKVVRSSRAGGAILRCSSGSSHFTVGERRSLFRRRSLHQDYAPRVSSCQITVFLSAYQPSTSGA